MRYAGMIKNDVASAPGVCVSFFTQGCPFHCKGCHNPETWDYNGGYLFTYKIMDELINAIKANGIQRNLCIVGGEPLCDENIPLVFKIVKTIKQKFPTIKITIWTGYTWECLQSRMSENFKLKYILKHIEYLVDGRYIDELRDITLYMRGSKNQRILDMNKTLINDSPYEVNYGEIYK
jgi:anaerobic ribonucleoside-triphosphate reductase activating protein